MGLISLSRLFRAAAGRLSRRDNYFSRRDNLFARRDNMISWRARVLAGPPRVRSGGHAFFSGWWACLHSHYSCSLSSIFLPRAPPRVHYVYGNDLPVPHGE